MSVLAQRTDQPVGRPNPNAKRRGRVATVICALCQTPFEKFLSKVTARNFCSRTCQEALRAGGGNPNWRGGPATLTCQHCGTSFQRWRATVTEKSRFCSTRCRVAAQTIHESAADCRRFGQRLRDLRIRGAKCRASHSEAEWRDLLAKHDGRCVLCGSADRIERDHIVPISKGGDDAISNIQPLCKSCNCRKSNRL